MKKKITTLVLITTMTMTMLAACGNTNDKNTTPTIEASSEVAESKEESKSVEVSSEPTSESKGEETSEKKYSRSFVLESKDTAKVQNKVYEFYYIEDDSVSDCIMIFTLNEKTYAYFYKCPNGILNLLTQFYDDHVTKSNPENTSVIQFYWDVEPIEATLGESDDADYDQMISNGQFKFHFPSDYDKTKAWEVFNSFKVLTIDEANTLIEELNEQVQE